MRPMAIHRPSSAAKTRARIMDLACTARSSEGAWSHGLEQRSVKGTIRVRNLDVDLQHRDAFAAVDFHLDLVGIQGDVLGDSGKDLVPQDGMQIRAADPTFEMEQHPEPLARDRSRAATEKSKPHAALRPNTLFSVPLLSLPL